MVNLSLALFLQIPLNQNSFSNYGGVPVKAEYCHEAVSSSIRLVVEEDTLINFKGSSLSFEHFVNLRCPLRAFHSTTTFAIYRLLCADVRSCPISPDLSQEGV